MTDAVTRLRKDRERLAAVQAELRKRKALDAILALLRELPEQTRADVMGAVTTEFCDHCWTEQPEGFGCQCWNDE